jgi:hypothetical protein
MLWIEINEITVAGVGPQRGTKLLHKRLHDFLAEGIERINDKGILRHIELGHVLVMSDHRRAQHAGGLRIGNVFQGDAVKQFGKFNALDAAEWTGCGPQDDPAFS